jgi:hypothetical protein
MKEIAMKGTLKKVSLPRLLVALNRKAKTGTLVVKTPSFRKTVYLMNGEAIFASSSNEDDRLGEMLIKAGKITIEQYDESVKLLMQTDKRQGTILVELGYLSQRDLFWGVKYQVKEIICSLFELENGTYAFEEGEIPADEVITLKIGMNNLIYDGIGRINNWIRIRNEMPDPKTVPTLSDNVFVHLKGIELSRQEKKMISLIDAKRNMNEIIDRAKINTFEGMRFFYILWTIDAIEKKITE